jgi:hypothetical protein
MRISTKACCVTLLLGLTALAACRWQGTPTTTPTGEFGNGSGGYTAQCSGDFPDWISLAPPSGADVNPNEPGNQQPFQMAQAYPLGIPVFKNVGGTNVVDHWDPPAANTDAPWRAFPNFSSAANRTGYLNAIKDYLLQDMSSPGIEFDAVKNNAAGHRMWFHVPMMTAAGAKRRDPYHGVTSERALRPNEQVHWLNAGPNLKAVAIGYYNFLGGYAIGQVFNSYDLTKTDATKAKFIDGTLVFKLLFAEYDPSRISGPDPLLHAPAWWVQDVGAVTPASPTNKFVQVRLLQVDVAVKDDHFASTTGWVFSTFVYDESLTATEPNPWRRLTPIGLQWGNDPSVTATTFPATLNETWINPATPAAFAFADHHGRGGRLIGPVDNPVSSCLSCHSTGQVDPSQVGNATNYVGAAVIPPAGCSNAEQMQWFRNLPSGPAGSQPFGHANACPVNTATTGLVATDYSLQLQEGLQSVFGYDNGNPCFDLAKQHHDEAGDAEATASAKKRRLAKTKSLVRMKASTQLLGPTPDELHSR